MPRKLKDWKTLVALLFTLIFWPGSRAFAQGDTPQTTPPPTPQQVAALQQNVVACESQAGQRVECAANTAAGVALLRSTGSAACLLGKTWGYDDKGIWVSDGCGGQFYAGLLQPAQAPVKVKPLEHVPNAGFLLYDGDQGQIYFRLFIRAYLNQRNLDPTTSTRSAIRRPCCCGRIMQLQKFFAPFAGWFLTPKFRYYLYVWSSNPSQGDPHRSSAPATSATTSTAT